MANGWNSERRARQAELIRTWRPWESSTGPRTAAGKARSAMRGDKGGLWKLEREMLGALRAALAEHRCELRRARRDHFNHEQQE